MMITVIIMNMQNKLYTIQYNFSHHPMTDLQPVPEQRLWNAKLQKKTKLPGGKKKMFTLPDKRRIKLPDKRRAEKPAAPQPIPIHKFSMRFMVWNFSICQLGYLAGYVPSQLLHTCSLAEYEKLGKSL